MNLRTRFRRFAGSVVVGLLVFSGCTKMPVNEGTVFVPADSVDWLEPGDLVLGFIHADQIRAYPIPALSPIEVLNDVVGGDPVVVTWCPLSATGAIFSSRVGGEPKRFRFHPDLHHMNLLFEDAERENAWSQLASKAVDGPEEGTGLALLPSVQMTWGEWRRAHPETTVLRPDWGVGRFSYRLPREEPAPGSRADQELALVVFGAGETRVYPFRDLARGDGPVSDVAGGDPMVVHFNPTGPTAFATQTDGDLLPSVVIYWKYLEDFFPDVHIWGT